MYVDLGDQDRASYSSADRPGNFRYLPDPLQMSRLPVADGPGENTCGIGLLQMRIGLLLQRCQRIIKHAVRLLEIHRFGMLLLTQFLAAGIDYDRHMRVNGRGIVQAALQPDLSGGRVEQIVAAHHIGDPLPGIIYNDGKLVGKQTVSPSDNKIAHIQREILLAVPLQAVVEANRLMRHLQSYRSVSLPAQFELAAMSRVNSATTRFSTTAVAGIQQLLVVKLRQGFAIGCMTLALVNQLPVPGEAECFEGQQNRSECLAAFAWGVEIFDTNEPATIARARIEITGEGC